MEKKSKNTDIHKLIQRDYTEYHKVLDRTFGSNNPFAKISLGAGFYSWSDRTHQWEPLSAADELDVNEVRNAVQKARVLVATKIHDNELVDKLFTVPDDSYIYYTNDDGVIRVLLTGWGFKKPVNVRVREDLRNLHKDNPVSMSFFFDGERLANHEFVIQSPKREVVHKTDGNGMFSFPSLSVGKSFMVIDRRSGKQMNLQIEEGKSHYDFDVTTYSDVNVVAKKDGSPLMNEPVQLVFHGKAYNAITNTTGAATFHLPRHEGETISATVQDKTKTEALNAGGNRIEFAFETPKAIVNTNVRVLVFCNGEAVSGAKVSIDYAGNVYDGFTGQNGVFEKTVEVEEGKVCKVSVDDYCTKDKVLSEISVNEFMFEKEISDDPEEPIIPEEQPEEPEPEEPELKDVTVQFLDKAGKPMAGETVVFKQGAESGAKETTIKLDEYGMTKFPENTFPKNKPLDLTIKKADAEFVKIPFTIEDDEYEYVLQEKEGTSSSWKNVLLQILAVILGLALSWFAALLLDIACPALFESIYS